MKQKAYTNYDNLVFVSPEYNVIKANESTLLKKHKLQAVDWGIDLENLYCVRNNSGIKKKYNIPENKRIILSVGSFLNDRKGIRKFFMECAKQTTCEDLIFVNVGFDGDEKMCPSNYLPIKYVDNQITLSELYSCADLFVIASTADTMPLACLISLGCGTPICCFNISGLPYLADETCATFIEAENEAKLLEAIECAPYKNNEIIDRCRTYALKRYSDRNFYKRLLDLAEKNI
jgi:glycosyltransferase involved in cell wall biosynthesis